MNLNSHTPIFILFSVEFVRIIWHLRSVNLTLAACLTFGAALFVSLAIGYWIGKIKMGNFQLGSMAGTLLVAIVIGQVGVMGGKNRKDEYRTRQRRASIYPPLVW